MQKESKWWLKRPKQIRHMRQMDLISWVKNILIPELKMIRFMRKSCNHYLKEIMWELRWLNQLNWTLNGFYPARSLVQSLCNIQLSVNSAGHCSANTQEADILMMFILWDWCKPGKCKYLTVKKRDNLQEDTNQNV